MDSKKIIIIAMAILGLFPIAFGQNIRVETLSLAPQPADLKEEVNFYIEEIIDNRFSKSYIGIVQKGLYNNVRLPLVFEKPMLEELHRFFDVIFPKESTSIALTIRINDIFVSEDTDAFKEVGLARVQLDVLKPISENRYEILGSAETISSKNTLDATGSHGKRIKSALTESLLKCYRENPNWESKGEMNLDNFSEIPPILEEPIEKGFFYTFIELQNNRSVRNDSVIILPSEERNKTEKLLIQKPSGGTFNYIAYYDGTNIYLNSTLYSNDEYFVKTYKVDKFLLFNEMFLEKANFVSDLNLAMGRSELAYMQDRNCFLFDLSTGIFHGITREKMKNLLDGRYPEFYKLYKRFGKKDVSKVLEILQVLFEKESPQDVREVLVN